MKLKEFKELLAGMNETQFQLPDGNFVPPHFHITEVGKETKDFIDCGGTLRSEAKINLQLWKADDYDHRLLPSKLLAIIQKSEEVIGLPNAEIKVEYQQATVGVYGVDFNDGIFVLTNTHTDCLAKDKCGIPVLEKAKVSLSEIANKANSCAPGSGCC